MVWPQVSVGDTLVTLMTHPEIVSLIRTGAGDTELGLTVERGDHIVPNIREAFPVKTEQELEQVKFVGIIYTVFLIFYCLL